MSSNDPLYYVRIAEGEKLPDLSDHAPYRAVVVLDSDYSSEWQEAVSAWLVAGGCLYMMAWGPRCSDWDDSVDWANLEQFDFGEVPDDRFVMTTWHEQQSLEEVFWFAGFCAYQGDVDLKSTVIVHVGRADRSEELLARFEAAQQRI